MGKDHAISKANQIPVSEKRSVRVHPFISEAVFDMSFEKILFGVAFFLPFKFAYARPSFIYVSCI